MTSPSTIPADLVAAAADRFAPFPLTDTQRAYLLGRGDVFELGNVSTHAYFEFDGDLDLDRFTAAWRRLIERHDMLRAVMLPDRMSQQVLRTVPTFTPDVVDLRHLALEEAEARLAQVREELSHLVRPPDHWPLFGVTVALVPAGGMRVYIGFDGLACDFASWHVLSTELSIMYSDPTATLPNLGLTFREYVLAELELHSSAEHREAERYWLNRIAALPPAPRLPLAADPADVRRPRFVRREAVLDAGSWSTVKDRARSAGLTPSAFLLAVFAETLAAWADEPHFTINVPRMNRLPLHPQVNQLVGEFASFTLIEVDNRGREPFDHRARKLQARMWEDLSHHQVSGAWMLRQLARQGGGMDRAQMPVVMTSTLAWASPDPTVLDGLWRQVYGVSQTPQVYLDLQLDERRGALVYNWDVVEAILPPALAQAMFDGYGQLLRRLTDDPDAWHSADLDLLPPGQRARREAAQGPARALSGALVQDAFLGWTDRAPDRPAVITSGATLSYGELRQRATRIAGWLARHGAGPDVPVTLLLDKGWPQVVAVYATLLSGAAYVPIDASLPPAAIRTMVDRAAAPLALVESGGPGAADLPPSVRALAVDAPTMAAGDAPIAHPIARDSDLLYVLYTSGSTGTPKGVMIEHAGMVNALRETATTFGITESDRCLGVTALHHDMSAFDLFGILGAGGALVLPDADAVRDPAHWLDLIERHRVTVWNSVPAMLEMLLEQAERRPQALASLRLVFTGGDWIPLTMARRLFELAPNARLVSVGGPTETTLWNIWFEVDEVDPRWSSIPYGRPIANTSYHLLDDRLRDRPDGVVGEMYCHGVGVARGYRDDKDRTDAGFVTHPGTGERLYRTGDLGRYRDDGTLEFVGRADAQVKIRGQRIELGDVEAALAAHPSVAAAVVVALGYPERPGSRALVAFVRLMEATSVTTDELRAYVRERRARHLVPAEITIVEAFPLTPNGKVDRAALVSLAGQQAPVRIPDGPPEPVTAGTPPLERLLTRLWTDALGVPAVRPDDDYFALGGDSLLGARILTRLRDVFEGEDLPSRTLFGTLTVAGMASAMRAQQSAPGRLDLIAGVYLDAAVLTPAEIDQALRDGD
jgi:amino acid adenylation domain-containing protein